MLPASGNVTLFKVPVGHRVVITDLHGVTFASSGVSVTLFNLGLAGPLFRVVGSSGMALDWQGRAVLHENETAYAQSTAQARFYVSGWLLTGAGGPLTPVILPT